MNRYFPRKMKSNNSNKMVYVPYLSDGDYWFQPKYASLGEQEEYHSLADCQKRCKELNKNK